MSSTHSIAIPGAGELIATKNENGEPFVILKPACERIGVDVDGQRRKLEAAGWATTEFISAVAEDGKVREMFSLHADCVPMWLATIQVNRVPENVRPVLIAFQREAAKALRDYFYDGGAINPSASVDQLEVLVNRSTAQMNLIKLAQGLIDPKHLEAKARIVLARALGEAPELNAADVPLYVSDFLKAKGLASDLITAKSSGFGKRLKGAYLEAHGTEPRKAHQELPNGTIREVNAYTEADRHLFEQVWVRHYSQVVAA
jgi:hypothetical protein